MSQCGMSSTTGSFKCCMSSVARYFNAASLKILYSSQKPEFYRILKAFLEARILSSRITYRCNFQQRTASLLHVISNRTTHSGKFPAARSCRIFSVVLKRLCSITALIAWSGAEKKLGKSATSQRREQVPSRYKDASGWMNGWMYGWMKGWMDG